MDLKHYKDKYFIHFIDLFTRYSKAKVIHRKQPQIVVKAFINEWIGMGLGAPAKVLVDNGGEFDNPEYLDAMEQFNIEVMATAANSPWSNGIFERNHCVVDGIVEKMLEEEPNLNLEIALSNAVNAKNCLTNHNGFAPVQLVTGQLPNLPSVINDKLPALHKPQSEVVLTHLNAMHAARSTFVAAESSERIKRGLRHQVRVTEDIFMNGEKVYYKKDGCNRWRGPARVIGQDGKVIFIRHGSRVLRVSSCKVVKINSLNPAKDGNVEVSTNETKERTQLDVTDDTRMYEENSEESDEALDETLEERLNELQFSTEPVNGSLQLANEPEKDELPTNEPIIADNLPIDSEKSNDEDELVDRKRISRPPKRYVPEEGSWRQKANEEANMVIIPKIRHSEDIVKDAKLQELLNWKEFEVIDEIEDKGQKTISTRWVVTEKDVDGKKAAKARLVVRGFEEDEELSVDAPTAAKATLRTAFAIAANKSWRLETIDIKGAFLQGKTIQRDVFVNPPDDIKMKGVIWRLRKTVYGLNDAARAWYFTLVEELKLLKCTQSELDKAAFRYYKNDQFEGLLVIHVDDILIAGDDKFHSEVVERLLTKFKIGKRNKGDFRYVGIDVHQSDIGDIFVSQNDYVDEIPELDVNVEGRLPNDGLTAKETKDFRAVSGQILWAATQTRIDISYDALELSMERNKPTIENMKRANKIIRKLHLNQHHIVFKRIDNIENICLLVFADASFANLPDGTSSAGGYIVLLASTKSKLCCIIDWSSTKIKRVVDNTLEGEAISLRYALGNAIYLGHMISEFYGFGCLVNRIPVIAYTDNKSLEMNIRSTKQPKGKRLRIDLAEIRRMINENEVI